jgi:hypothetical protein
METHEQDADQDQHEITTQQAAAKNYQPNHQVCSQPTPILSYVYACRAQASVRTILPKRCNALRFPGSRLLSIQS